MKYKDIYNLAMPERKRKEEKWNLWVTLAVRPLSIVITMPFTKMQIRPTTITKWSILSNLIGFLLVSFFQNMIIRLVGWFFFFIWAVLDGVDGNLARTTKQCSPIGDLWDTTGGYAAMVLIYLSAGISAFYESSLISFCEPYWMLILGGTTAIMSIFPRLVMHKKKSLAIDSNSIKSLSDKENFDFFKILAMNLVSPSGAMQVLFLFAICFHLLNLFIAVYFLVNLVIMTFSLRGLLKE